MSANLRQPSEESLTALFDPDQFAVLCELQEDGDTEIIVEVVQQFLEDADAAQQRLAKFLKLGDYHGCREVAHTLKGSFATFGLLRAQRLAHEIEQLAQHSQGHDLPLLSRAMLGCFLASKRVLEAHLERFTGEPRLA